MRLGSALPWAAVTLGMLVSVQIVVAPLLVLAGPGSYRDEGPAGLSGFAAELEEMGVTEGEPNVLALDRIVLTPFDTVLMAGEDVPLARGEVQALQAHLRSGGRIAVIADDEADAHVVQQILGFDVEAKPVRDASFNGTTDRPLVPWEDQDGTFLQFDAPITFSPTDWFVSVWTTETAWVTAERPEHLVRMDEHPLVATRPVGEGELMLVGDLSPFTNEGRGWADNARLVQHVEEWTAARGGIVVLDQAHQEGAWLRLDAVIRAASVTARALALGAAIMAVGATVLVPWPALVAATVRVLTPAQAGSDDLVATVQARHQDWDPSFLTELAGPNQRAGQ